MLKDGESLVAPPTPRMEPEKEEEKNESGGTDTKNFDSIKSNNGETPNSFNSKTSVTTEAVDQAQV